MSFWCLQFFRKTNLKILIFYLSFVFWKNWKKQKSLVETNWLLVTTTIIKKLCKSKNLSNHIWSAKGVSAWPLLSFHEISFILFIINFGSFWRWLWWIGYSWRRGCPNECCSWWRMVNFFRVRGPKTENLRNVQETSLLQPNARIYTSCLQTIFLLFSICNKFVTKYKNKTYEQWHLFTVDCSRFYLIQNFYIRTH